MPSRVSPLEPPYPEPVRDLLDQLMAPRSVADDPVYRTNSQREPTKFFRTWVRHPELARAFQSVREWMHAGTLTDSLFRELIALRICALTGAHDEWSLRVAIYGEKVGLTQEQLRSTALGGPADLCWSARERSVVNLADELHRTSTVSDALWNDLARNWSPEEIMELLFIAGWYVSLCFVANGVRMEGEAWAPPYPKP